MAASRPDQIQRLNEKIAMLKNHVEILRAMVAFERHKNRLYDNLDKAIAKRIASIERRIKTHAKP